MPLLRGPYNARPPAGAAPHSGGRRRKRAGLELLLRNPLFFLIFAVRVSQKFCRATGYFSSLAHRNHEVSLFQHRLDMELLFLLELVLMAAFFGLKSFVAQQKKDDYQEMSCRMKKSKKPDIDEIQMLETLARSYKKKEKGWRIAFLCAMVGIVFHLAFIVSLFGI